MFTQISGNDPVFDSESFLSEEVRFNLLHLIRESELPVLLSNEKQNIIIGRGSNKFPCWVWTSDAVSKEDVSELCDTFIKTFRDAEKLSVVAKPEIVGLLAERYSEYRNIEYKVNLEMQSHHCPVLITPKALSGNFDRPNEHELYIIASFLAGFGFDCYGKESTPDEHLEKAKKLFETGDLYFWRDNKDIVSMVNIGHRSPRHARINLVYTRPDMRNKGYAANIVFKVCEIIKCEGLTPMLYTDINYPASNKAYKNVGFVECGRVTEIKFKIPKQVKE